MLEESGKRGPSVTAHSAFPTLWQVESGIFVPGFENLSAKAFVKMFKKYFNLTPKALVKIFEKS